MQIAFKDLGIPYESGMGLDLHNVITGEKLGVMRDYYMTSLEGRSCVILKGKLCEV